jgi:hypothetical protein
MQRAVAVLVYEEKNRQQVVEFKSQPYMKHEYPSLRKHYPGTWKLSTMLVVIVSNPDKTFPGTHLKCLVSVSTIIFNPIQSEHCEL